jgi:excisionase family DNA binding protein
MFTLWHICSIPSGQNDQVVYEAVKSTSDEPGKPRRTDFLTRSQVSRLLGVSPNTVTRWAREGRIACQVTLGGHHRFERAVVEQLQKDLTRGASRID